MDAMKEALKRKMQEGKGKMGMGEPKPDLEIAGDKVEGDPFEKKMLKEENDLAPESDGEEPKLEGEEMAMEGEETDLLRQILAALSDRGNTSGRGPMGLAERAAEGAKGKLAGMKKAY